MKFLLNLFMVKNLLVILQKFKLITSINKLRYIIETGIFGKTIKKNKIKIFKIILNESSLLIKLRT